MNNITDQKSNGYLDGDEPRLHKEDIMSPETRSAVMSRIRGNNTGPERLLAAKLEVAGLNWKSHESNLPGSPDFVSEDARVAVPVDGDFWHGWQFHRWRKKLSAKWEAKIDTHIRRNTKNRRQLRRMGWTVVRIWEHQLKKCPDSCLYKLLVALFNKSHTV